MPHQSQQIVETKSYHKDHSLQRKNASQVIVFVVLDQQCTNAAFTHAQPLHHRDHHPGDGKVLPYHLEDLVGLAYDDDLIQTLPAIVTQSLTQLVLLRGYTKYHRKEGSRKERHDTKYQQR